MPKRILILGAGPSGMMAAISAKSENPQHEIILIDGNKRLGTKMRLTGGGRCNLTANVPIPVVIQNVVKNNRFLYSSLHRFGPEKIMDFFEKHGCPLKEEDHHRMFPVTDRSVDVVNTLEQKLNKLDVRLLLGERVTKVAVEEKCLYVGKKAYPYDALIVATGGVSFSGTGSDGFGYEIAKKIGHSIHTPKPAEVPLVSHDQVIQEKILQGLSFQDVGLTIPKTKTYLKHDLLFTHFGLSGPLALRASTYVLEVLQTDEVCPIKIDFLPEINHEEVIRMLKSGEKLPLPERLLKYLQSQSQNNELLLQNIKAFKMNIHETRGWRHAFLTNGGVEVKEVNPKTMQSKKDLSIYFCGEVLDYHAFTGGFNLTCAFSTGYTAGYFAAKNCSS